MVLNKYPLYYPYTFSSTFSSADSTWFESGSLYKPLAIQVNENRYDPETNDMVRVSGWCLSDFLRNSIESSPDSQNDWYIPAFNCTHDDIRYALKHLRAWNATTDTLPRTVPAGSQLTQKELVLLHRLQRAGLLQLARREIMVRQPMVDSAAHEVLPYDNYIAYPIPGTGRAYDDIPLPEIPICRGQYYEDQERVLLLPPPTTQPQIEFGDSVSHFLLLNGDSVPHFSLNAYRECAFRVPRTTTKIQVPIFRVYNNAVIKGVYLTETNDPQAQALMPPSYKPADRYTAYPVRWNPADALRCTIDQSVAMAPAAGDLLDVWMPVPLRGGYTYTFTADINKAAGAPDAATEMRFFVKVVPDTLIWQPLAGSLGEWNADFNWCKANGDTSGSYTAATAGESFVPLAHSYVIVPPQADGNYPSLQDPRPRLLSNIPISYNQTIDAYHEEELQPFITFDRNYTFYQVNTIAFCAGSMIGGQSLLKASHIYVDMPLLSRRWNFVSSPLEDTYTGDFYSADDAATDTLPFNLRPLGARQTHPVWFRYYSDSVENVTNGPDNTIVSNAQWGTPSNQMGTKIDWRGGAVWAFDQADSAAHDTHIIMRLPKADTVYHYYERNSGRYLTKQQVVQKDSVGRFLMKSFQTTIPLENKYGNMEYAFGNPALAKINWSRFYAANINAIQNGRYYFTKGATEDDMAEIGINGNGISSGDTTGTGIDINYIQPMQGVLLIANYKGPNADYRHANVIVEEAIFEIIAVQ